jgi:uncharacterized DUF497 family protein
MSGQMVDVQFTWDERKNRASEPRWQTIGMVNGIQVVVVRTW